MTELLFTRTADNKLHFYTNDHLGTPQKAFRRNGKVTWKAKVSALGETEVWAESELRNNLRFPGQYFDSETGINYNFQRDYWANIGRYVQGDPIGLHGGLNSYGCVYSNPLRFHDPYGLWSMDPVWGFIYDATGGASFDQSTVDFAAGFGDTLSFGLTDWARNQLGINSVVDKCSVHFSRGEIAGITVGFLSGGTAGWRAAGNKAKNFQFSHWIPSRYIRATSKFYKPLLDNRFGRWFIKGHNKWNGNYVHVTRHYKHDPFATGNRDFPGRSLGPKWNTMPQQLDRIPDVYKGAGLGASVMGASAGLQGGCGCSSM